LPPANLLRSGAGEQETLTSPLRILGGLLACRRRLEARTRHNPWYRGRSDPDLIAGLRIATNTGSGL